MSPKYVLQAGSYFSRFCIEELLGNFLQMDHLRANQDYLIRKGVLKTLLGRLSEYASYEKGRQMSFDLLAKLVHFNYAAFKVLEVHLDAIDPMHGNYFKLMTFSELWDTNIFLRSSMLSFNYFSRCKKIGLDFDRGSLLYQITTVQIQVRLVYGLMKCCAKRQKADAFSCINTIMVTRNGSCSFFLGLNSGREFKIKQFVSF